MKSSFSLFSLIVVAVVTISGAAPLAVSAQQLVPPAFSIIPEPEVHASISNFAHVSKGIWRGGQPSEKALEELAQSGVKTIVDLRMEGSGTVKEDEISHRLGVKYVHIPMGFTKPSAEQIAAFFSIVKNQDSMPIFVHCRQGADRTGTLIGLYRRLVQGWSFRQTYAEMREHHFKPFLEGMRELVKNCDREFDSNGKTRVVGITAQNLDFGQPVR